MKKRLLSLLLVFVMLFALALPALADDEATTLPDSVAVGSANPADGVGEGWVVILHSNDVHGAIEGYAKMAALKHLYEEAGAEVIVVDAGDFSQGDPNVSLSQGATAVELMNLVGYDIVTAGNHEFDYGYANLVEILKKAEFEFINANIVDEDGVAVFEPSTMWESEGGVKIGFVGLETPETATKAHPAKIKGLKFLGSEELYACAEAQVEALADADVVVCLGHLGIDEESAINGNRSVDFLKNVSGVDVFIDAHSHSTLGDIAAVVGNDDRTVNGAVITSTGTKFANIGVVTISPEGEIATDCIDTGLIDVEALGCDECAAVAARAKEIANEVEANYGATFAESKVDLNGEKAPGNRTEETNMGDLITDAMLWLATKDELSVPNENVIAITNGGGIRAAIAAGDVSKKGVNTVLPFGNTVAVDYVSGAVLLEALEASTFCTPTAVGGFPQVAGIDFTINTGEYFISVENYPGTTYGKPAVCNRVTINSINGKEFDPEATYAVVTNDFVAAGGDTYYALSVSDTITDTGVPLDEALMQYITEVLEGVIPESYAEPAGRIHIVEGESKFAAAIENVKEKGIMTGTNKGFEPTGTVTRGTVFQTLYNMEGKPEMKNKMVAFEDIAGKWFENAASWSEQVGLTKGTGNGFMGERDITHGEVITILYRYAQYLDDSIKADETTDTSAFGDGDKIPNWAKEAYQWAITEGIVDTEADNLRFGDKAVRVELAQMLTNFKVEKVEKPEETEETEETTEPEVEGFTVEILKGTWTIKGWTMTAPVYAGYSQEEVGDTYTFTDTRIDYVDGGNPSGGWTYELVDAYTLKMIGDSSGAAYTWVLSWTEDGGMDIYDAATLGGIIYHCVRA